MNELYVPGRKILSSRPDDEMIDGTMIMMAHTMFIAREELLAAFADLEDAKDYNVKGQFAISYSHIQKTLDRMDQIIEMLENT